MLQRLSLELFAKLQHHGIAHGKKHSVGVSLHSHRHGANNSLEHENILYFSHIGHENIFEAQVFHLFVLTAVAVNNAVTIQMVKCAQIIESPR